MATEALKQLTGMPKLPITKGLMASAPPAPKGYMGPKEIAPAQEELRSAMVGAEQKVGEADVAIEEAKRQEKAREAQMKAGMLREYKADLEQMPERAALKESREKLEGMEFVPTRDTVNDIAGLFSLIGVIGMVVGKGNAVNAMNAMNGMMEGHKKGRADLFKQELQEFDKNFKAMQAKVNAAKEQFEEAIKLKAVDKEAGELEMQVALAKMESPLLKAMKDKQGDVAVLNALKGVSKDMETGIALRNDLQAKADTRAFQERQLAQQERLRLAQMEQTKELALLRAGAKDTKPPPKEIVAQNQLRNNLIPKIEEALPVLERLNKEGKWNTMTTLLAIDPRAAELQFKDDKEALNLILTLAYFRSKEFETAGKALTKKEDQILAPIVRGDLRAYEGIKNAMEEGVKSLKQEQKGLEATYPFIREYNKVVRGETGETQPSAPSGKPMPTGDKLKAYADQHFDGDEEAAKNYLKTQGYQ